MAQTGTGCRRPRQSQLDEAIAFAIAHENSETKDLAIAIPNQFRNEAPYNTLIGPTQPRAGANGLIIRRGSVIAEWGDTARADMTFSVTKTFLSTVVGLAFDRGQISNLTDRVATYMPKGVDLFTSPHNAPITWEHLLRQTSDWSGTFGANRTGPTARPGIRLLRSGNSGNCTTREPSTNTTTRGSTSSHSRRCMLLKRPLPEF